MIVDPASAPGPRASNGPRAPGARDLRLDFFRGLAMFIILLAHIPANTWTLWIPARFGFSDATEMFVFCSGFASALAFGAVFARAGLLLGTARILHRVWQVYWAHIGVFLVAALVLYGIDHYGLGLPGKTYIQSIYIVPFFEQTGEALIGLLTLSYVPPLFDILPMYLVILAMIPAVMALHRVGGTPAVAAAVVGLWLAANLAGYARTVPGAAEAGGLMGLAHALGSGLQGLNLSGSPFQDHTWYFNPFAWQIVFFAGFAFGMGWLPAPPVMRGLVILAAAYVLLVVPFAWYRLHEGVYLARDGWLHGWLAGVRAWSEPLWWKTWAGALRFLHFLALAYLAWVAVGAGGRRLLEGLRPAPALGGWRLAAAGGLALLSLPYAYVDEILLAAPELGARIAASVAPGQLQLLQLLHVLAVLALVWSAIGDAWRAWIAGDLFRRAVPVIAKVGTQSLAVFMTSMVLAIVLGLAMDLIGPYSWPRAGVNFIGFGILIGTAYLVGWFKGQPWRPRSGGPQSSGLNERQRLVGIGA